MLYLIQRLHAIFCVMWLYLLSLSAACALAVLWVRWRRVREYWARRGVPHAAPHPLLGSLTFLLRRNAGLWMRDMYRKFKSPYIGIWLFWRPALIINCPEIARRVLVKDSDVFRDRFLSGGKSDTIGQLTLFTVKDPTWTSVRRRLTFVFTSARLKAFHSAITTKARELVQRIRNDVDQKKTIYLKDLFSDYTTDVIGTAAFGVAGDATLSGGSPLRRITREWQQFSLFRGFIWCCFFFCPELMDFFGFHIFPKATTAYFKKIFHSMVEQRGGYDKLSQEHGDVIDALVKMKQDAAKDNEDMEEDLLVAQAVAFLQGGFDTSSSAISFMTHELAHHPQVQEKLHKELSEARERNGGSGEFDQTTYGKLTYLNCVIKENLRKYAPMGWLDRIASKDYQIDENLTIPAGTPVYVNGMGIMTDPDYFPDPESFNPDRFLPENEHNIKPFTYIPFGDGPRTCIGLRFAYQTLRYALCGVVLHFELRPRPGALPPSDGDVDPLGMFLMPKDIAIEFVPREISC